MVDTNNQEPTYSAAEDMDVQNHQRKEDPSLFEHVAEPKNVGVDRDDSHAVLYSTDHDQVPVAGGAADQLLLSFKGKVYVFDLVTSEMVLAVISLLGRNKQVATEETLQNSSEGLDDLPSCRSSQVVERTAAAVAASLNDDGLRRENKKETSVEKNVAASLNDDGLKKNKKETCVEKNINNVIMKEVAARMKRKNGGVYEKNVAAAASLNHDGLRWENKKETSVEKNIDYTIMKEVAARMKMIIKGGIYEKNVAASLNDDGFSRENKKETSAEKNIDHVIMKEVATRMKMIKGGIYEKNVAASLNKKETSGIIMKEDASKMKRKKGGGDECTPLSNYAIMKEVAARMKMLRQGSYGRTSPVLQGHDQEKEKKEEDHEVT